MTHSFNIFTIDPRNPAGKRIEAIISGDLILRLYKYNPVQYENFKAVKAVLDDPKRIYTGIRTINEGGWCYVGRPKTWHIEEDIEVLFPEDRLFAVYLNNRMYIYDFAAEYIDDEDPLSPRDWKNRFTGLVWKSIS